MSLLRWIALALSALVIAAATAYLRDIGRAYDRIAGESRVVASPAGDIDNRAALPNERIARIVAPTLVVHAAGHPARGKRYAHRASARAEHSRTVRISRPAASASTVGASAVRVAQRVSRIDREEVPAS